MKQDPPAYTAAGRAARAVLSLLERKQPNARFLYRCLCGEGSVIKTPDGHITCTNCGDQWS